MKASQRVRNRIVLAMDSQLLQSFQWCQRQYYLTAAEHLVKLEPFRTVSGAPRAKNSGTIVHDIMHRVNRAKLWRHKLTDTQLLDLGMKRIKRDKDWTQDEKLFMSTKWVQFYAWDKFAGQYYKPIGTETGFSKVLYEDEDVIFVYEGRIDLIVHVEPAEINSWVDYKTQGREAAIYKNRNQFMGYSWALNTNIGFILVFGMQKEKEEAFAYRTVCHSDTQIATWRTETIRCFREVLLKSAFGKSQFSMSKANCDAGMYGWCQFVKLCDNASAPPEVQAGLKRMFYKEREWKPWEKLKWH